MAALRAVFARLRGVISGRSAERELASELESHLQLHVDDNLRAGMPVAEARRLALLTLGGLDQTKEQYRDRRGVPIVENAIRDLRYGARRLGRSPGFTCAAVVMVALGVGANTMTFSQVYGLIIRPLPYDRTDRLVLIGTSTVGEVRRPDWMDGVSAPELEALMASQTSLAELAPHRRRLFNVTGGRAEPQQVSGTEAASTFFSIFGVQARLGRTFTAAEEAAGDRVVVLSHRLWRQAFGADPSIIDRQISLNRTTFTVVGVLSAELAPYDSLVRAPADLWVPLVLTSEERRDRAARSLAVVARLADRVSREQAAAELARISRQVTLEHTATNGRVVLNVAGLKELLFATDSPAILMLQGAVLFVLLIACMNIANLLLARGMLRGPEIGIRLSLGASRTRIVGQLVAESLPLFVMGAALAIPIAEYGNRWFLTRVPFPLPDFLRFDTNLPVLAFTGGVTLVAGVVSGLLPALLMTARDPARTLKHGARGTAAGLRRRVSSLLVAAEIASAVVLLTGAGLMVRSLTLIQQVDPGFNHEGVLAVEISLPSARYATAEQKAAFVRDLTPKVEAVPGITGAGWTTRPPLYGSIDDSEIVIEGRPVDEVLKPKAQFATVNSQYFTALGIPLLSGHLFDDGAPAAHTVLVNETMARRYWPNQSAIGQRIRRADSEAAPAWSTIVGVVADARHDTLRYPVAPEVYLPIAQSPPSSAYLVLRAPAGAASVIRSLKEAVWSIDPELPASNVRTMDEVMELEFWFFRTIATALGSFSVIALVLSALGTFAVVSYLTSHRTQEIGVRIAFGAARGDIFRLVFGQAGAAIGLGITVGTLLTLALGGALDGQLYGVTPFDPPTFIGALVLLTTCAALAVYVPARRAARMDPAAALRHE